MSYCACRLSIPIVTQPSIGQSIVTAGIPASRIIRSTKDRALSSTIWFPCTSTPSNCDRSGSP